MTIGPVQLLVVGFEGGESNGEILAELDRLRENDIVRLIDLVVVRKDADGNLGSSSAATSRRRRPRRWAPWSAR